MKKNTEVTKLPDDIIAAIYSHEMTTLNSWINTNNIDYADGNKRTMLFHAIFAKYNDLITHLINQKTNLNIKDKNGWYPLHYIAQGYLPDIAVMLVSNVADVEVKDNFGNTPLWRAVFASQGKGELIRILLKNGADPNNSNNYNISPFKLANTIANYNIKQFFVEPPQSTNTPI